MASILRRVADARYVFGSDLTSERGCPMRKSWRTPTTDKTFAVRMQTRCAGNHVHDWAMGDETKSTGFYTPQFAKGAVKSMIVSDQQKRNLSAYTKEMNLVQPSKAIAMQKIPRNNAPQPSNKTELNKVRSDLKTFYAGSGPTGK